MDDAPASTEVYWGPFSTVTVNYPNHSNYGGLTAAHSRTLTGPFSPGVNYFRVRSTAGAVAESAEYVFTLPADPATPLDTMAPNGPVRAVARVGNTVYLGGDFTSVGTVNGHGFAVGSPTAWDAGWGRMISTNQPIVDGTITALAQEVTSQSFYIAGTFTHVGGQAHHGIARILPDFGVDPNFTADVDFTVKAMAVAGSTLFIGGTFTKVNGSNQRYLAALHPLTGVTIGPSISVDGPVNALLLQGQKLYLGGSFSHVAGSGRASVAMYDLAAGNVGGAPNVTIDGPIDALAILGQTLYVGGLFTSPKTNAAAINMLDSGVFPWDPAPDDEVLTMLPSGSSVYVGGRFTHIGPDGGVRLHGARIDGTTAIPYPWNPAANGEIRSISQSSGLTYVAGDFRTLDGGFNLRRGVALTDSSTGGLSSWNPLVDGPVNVVMPLVPNLVYLGGSFISSNPSTRLHAAALDVTTGDVTAWNPVVDDTVRAIVVDGGTVYLGGDFLSIGTSLRAGAAAVDANTGVTLGWNPGFDGGVYALAVDGPLIYAGGAFTHIQGQLFPRFGAVTLGGLPRLWTPPTFDAPVYAIGIDAGTIYVGGAFARVGVNNQVGTAAFSANGTASSWRADPMPASSTVNALAFTPLGVIVGGSFLGLGGTFAGGLGLVDPESGARIAWANGFPDQVNAAVFSPPMVVVGWMDGGAFFDGTGQPGPWDPGIEGSVNAIAADCSSGYVAFGGAFDGPGSVFAPNFALFHLDAGCSVPPSVTTGPASNITSSSAVLGGESNAHGLTTVGSFRLSLVPADVCVDTTGIPVPDGGSLTPDAGGVFSVLAAGLLPATPYWYCAVATNAAGSTFGGVASFVTLSAPDGGADGGYSDGGSPSDGGTADAGPSDGGTADAGPPDGGTDGGAADGGPSDGGSSDGGEHDAGKSTDGGYACTVKACLVDAPPPTDAGCGVLYEFRPSLDSAPNDLQWELAGGPDNLDFTPGTGRIRWTPTPRQRGDHPLTLQALSAGVPVVTYDFTVSVSCPGDVGYGTGCGCNTPGGAFSTGLALLLFARRRRR